MRDPIRLGIDPITVRFSVANALDFIKRYKHHDAYVKKSKMITETAKSENFTDKIKWIEWYNIFINFLRAIMGRNGILLSYIAIVLTTGYGDFIDEYADKEPLTGQAYLTNDAKVHTYIIKFTLRNPLAEAKIVHNAQKNYGILNFIALKNHDEGVGVHAVDIVKADKIIQGLFYSGDKNPHMWWDKYERQLTDAFNTYDRNEKRSVHSDNQKLRMLNIKINAEFLQATKSSINLELARTPDNLSYDNALAAFRYQGNQKYPPELSTYKNRRPRRVNEVDSMGVGKGCLFQGRGRGYHGGRGGRGR